MAPLFGFIANQRRILLINGILLAVGLEHHFDPTIQRPEFRQKLIHVYESGDDIELMIFFTIPVQPSMIQIPRVLIGNGRCSLSAGFPVRFRQLRSIGCDRFQGLP